MCPFVVGNSSGSASSRWLLSVANEDCLTLLRASAESRGGNLLFGDASLDPFGDVFPEPSADDRLAGSFGGALSLVSFSVDGLRAGNCGGLAELGRGSLRTGSVLKRDGAFDRVGSLGLCSEFRRGGRGGNSGSLQAGGRFRRAPPSILGARESIDFRPVVDVVVCDANEALVLVDSIDGDRCNCDDGRRGGNAGAGGVDWLD